jgi:predicted membrane protein
LYLWQKVFLHCLVIQCLKMEFTVRYALLSRINMTHNRTRNSFVKVLFLDWKNAIGDNEGDLKFPLKVRVIILGTFWHFFCRYLDIPMFFITKIILMTPECRVRFYQFDHFFTVSVCTTAWSCYWCWGW